MKNILMVSNVQGMLVNSIKKQFEDDGYRTVAVMGDMKDISRVDVKIGTVIVYSDEDLANNQQTLVYLSDKCVEEDIPIFIIGDIDELAEIDKIIPEAAIPKKYVRPINVKEVYEEINDYLLAHDDEGKKKILVVDDSGAMLRNVKGWLEDKYQVILANSGAMAIKYLALGKPDLILLDYEMPIVDGRQVLEMIRAEVEFSDVPVMFLTSKNDKESVANVMRLKPEGYLLKTMLPQDVVKTIDDFFVKQKSRML